MRYNIIIKLQKMEQKINLKQLEKNTAATIFQTGLIEIMIGIIWTVVSLAMIFDDYSYYIDIFLIVPFVFIILARKYIIKPRMGIVNYAKKRVKRSMLMGVVITIFLVIMVGLTFFGMGSSIDEFINPRWSITGIIFFICVAIAFFLNYKRMYIYAFLLAGAFNVSEEARENPEILADGAYAYLIASVILFIIGSYYLIRFLKEYPKPELG